MLRKEIMLVIIQLLLSHGYNNLNIWCVFITSNLLLLGLRHITLCFGRTRFGEIIHHFNLEDRFSTACAYIVEALRV